MFRLCLCTFCLILAFCLTNGFVQAQSPRTEYWCSFGKNIDSIAIQISSQCFTKGSIHFTHTGQTVNFQVPPGETYTYKLTSNQLNASCHNVYGKNDLSVHICSDSAVSVSTIAVETASTDATSLLPLELLGTEYCLFRQSGRYMYPKSEEDEIILVSTANNTTVTRGGVPLCTLDRGETFFVKISDQIPNRERIIQSNHPVALFDVESMTFIPSIDGPADKSFEQYYPMQSLGKQFFVPVTYMGRELIQVLAVENNTTISQSGGVLRTDISGANKLNGLNAGEWAWIEIFHENNGCYISADKPVSVISFMTYNYYYLSTFYGDPSAVWVPSAPQRIKSCIVRPFVIKGAAPPPGYPPLPPVYHAIVVTPSAGKASCSVSVSNGISRPLYGGQWKDHSSGWSYYDMPLDKDSTYQFANQAFGMHVYSYGLAEGESYHMLASVYYRNRQLSFTANDTQHLKLPEVVFCEQEITFRAETTDSLNGQPGHIRWYIDSVEEIAARDKPVWKKHFSKGIYHIRLTVCYGEHNDTTICNASSILHVASLEADAQSTPEYCHRRDGSIAFAVASEAPGTLTYVIDSAVSHSNPVTGLKAGMYHVIVRDKYCQLEQQVFVDSVAGPQADFGMSDTITCVGMEILFTDRSVQGGSGISQWHWDMGDNSTYAFRDVRHVYRSEYFHLIRLMVIDSNKCSDIAQKGIFVLGTFLRFPNAFAPESGISENRFFHPMEEGSYYSTFDMTIYNRWGKEVWHQHCENGECPSYNDESFWWDGSDNQGRKVSAGVYFWTVKATYIHKGVPPLYLNGSVTLFR